MTLKIFSVTDISGLPGCCAQGHDPSLKDALEEDSRIFPRNDKIEKRQGTNGMDQQTSYNGHHVHTELGGCLSQIVNTHDLTGNQTSDTNRRIPAIQSKGNSSK